MSILSTRFFMTWLMTYAMVFNPLAYAKPQDQKSDFKNFLESSQITKKEMTLRQVYSLYRGSLDSKARAEMDTIVYNYGDMKLPKMQVSKVKGANGQDYFQLQGVKDGDSISMTIVNDDKVFMKMNGKNFSPDDMRSISKSAQVLGVDDDMEKAGLNFAPKEEFGFLSVKQIRQLPKQQKQEYFQRVRKLLEAMEDVQNLQMNQSKGKKSVQVSPSLIDFVYSQVLSFAVANDLGQSCYVAGHASTVGRRADGRLSCGATDNNLPRCSSGQLKCNVTVWRTASNGDVCVPVTNNATQACNEIVGQVNTQNSNQKNDIPAWADSTTGMTEERFTNEFKNPALAALAATENYCRNVQFSRSELTQDQRQTCDQLTLRKQEVASWQCSNASFKANYPKICPAVVAPGPVDPPLNPPVPPTEPPAPPRPSIPRDACVSPTNLEADWAFRKPSCGGSEPAMLDCTLRSSDVPVPIYRCDGSTSVGGVDGRPNRPGWFSRNKHWLKPLAGVAVGMLAFFWLYKRAYKATEPTVLPQDPPVTTPTVTIPAPRPDGVN